MALNITVEKEIGSWQDFVELTSSQVYKTKLYRGLPNKPRRDKEEKWRPFDLKTTYQRRYSSPDISEFYNKLEDFQKHKGNYEVLTSYLVGNNTNLLPLILFLRHAGIPMPVLDVTYDPLTALYFAVHGLYDQYGVRDTFERILENNPNGYVSVYEFDIDILEKYYGIKELDEVFKFQEFIDDTIYLVTDIGNLILKNPNMDKQDGAFIYYSSAYPIEIQLREQQLYSLRNGPTFPAPLIHYRISYESIFTEDDTKNVYTFLERINKVGYKLFADAQALLFDFINPSLRI